jgi:acetyl/propionyl-CoA carboxylase alpha subunit/acetyl-CoA carboxylase carboxyltransferase component
MPMRTLLIANRGEIAVRVLRSAAECGVRTVAVFATDDADAPHIRRADHAHPLAGVGPAAYLDIEQIVAAATANGCDAVHPGYGFLSESAAFARRCAAAGLTFVGPDAETLAALGDKLRARALAAACGVPVLHGSTDAVTPVEAAAFLDALAPDGAMVIKAVAGGGGRGLRVVHRGEPVADTFARCESEARAAFGNGALYVEELMPRVRHIEVQIVADAHGAVAHLGERECTIQRRHQKLVELAPCPSLPPALRERLIADAVRLATAVRYRNAGTFEFLVAADASDERAAYAFIEANPRLQVEHTVTEMLYGIDLVRAQLAVAAGASLADCGLAEPALARGFALQLRVNAEHIGADGTVWPSAGTLTAFAPPNGPGVRTDTAAAAGAVVSPRYDSLLAKVIAHGGPRFADAVARARRALDELCVDGVATNRAYLRRIIDHPDFIANRIDTAFVERHAAALAAADESAAPSSGRRIDPVDPLAVLAYGKRPPRPGAIADLELATDLVAVRAPMPGTVVAIEAREGDEMRRGQPIAILSAMKMEHVIATPADGVVRRISVAAGDTVAADQLLAALEPRASTGAAAVETAPADLARIRTDLAEVERRHEATGDAARPDAVARRRATGQRTARENIADLCDPDTFIEYGALAIAAQRQRRAVDELIARTPADGLITGIGRVNGAQFDDEHSRCAVLAYDYTVLAGTQGFQNHRKKDRLFALAERLRLPVVIFTEGGGGRPGDTDAPGVAGLDCMAFQLFGKLSGLVPLVGVNAGRCFAGNAALLGCCDVVIATAGSSIGMGGPAMIEGGGLGVFRPDEVGPMDIQVPNGVVDIAVADEAEAVRIAKQYLSYFQGAVREWDCADQRRLRDAVPENRLRVYDVRAVIETLADRESVLELRRHFAAGMITALARVEGRALGVIANDPRHLAGAIDAPGADKAARFMQLCDAFDLPILFLCDTPGIMVGPDAEATALVRHCCRLFVIGASLTVPFFTIVLRKSYGLGAQAMAGGSHKAPLFTVAWPTGEFGGMGLEGAVKLGFRRELEAIADPAERREAFDRMVARAYAHGQALNTASHFEIDDVIDPAASRALIVRALAATPPPPPRRRKKRPCIDTW